MVFWKAIKSKIVFLHLIYITNISYIKQKYGIKIMSNYVLLSLETHLFFARIMKEHALFLEAGFPGVEQEWIQKAEWFKQQFENLLRETVQISDGRVSREILESGEVVTEFTLPAEKSTERLSGIAIDSRITMQEQRLRPACCQTDDRNVLMAVGRINQRAMDLLDGFIRFKENILREVGQCRLFNANYPLLVEHILREAQMYRMLVQELIQNRELSKQSLCEIEEFWNRIMMEHALFIRGLLDPTEEELIETANQFAKEYKVLLERAKSRDCRAAGMMDGSLEETLRYRDFKTAGTEGILDCKIASIILPLLADHVLREANHYIRLLETANR